MATDPRKTSAEGEAEEVVRRLDAAAIEAIAVAMYKMDYPGRDPYEPNDPDMGQPTPAWFPYKQFASRFLGAWRVMKAIEP